MISSRETISKITLLRSVLILDAAVLGILGFALIIVPRSLARVFQFPNLPDGAHYLLALWGCVLATLAVGYIVAAQNPWRHVVWVQVGILRGFLECIVGLIYVAQGVVTLQQAGFGISMAGAITLLYVVLYPRRARAATAATSQPEPVSPS
ncbi:MAG: hypothetical protein AB1813_20070 [Verrucomicrobiota bacterium]